MTLIVTSLASRLLMSLALAMPSIILACLICRMAGVSPGLKVRISRLIIAKVLLLDGAAVLAGWVVWAPLAQIALPKWLTCLVVTGWAYGFGVAMLWFAVALLQTARFRRAALAEGDATHDEQGWGGRGAKLTVLRTAATSGPAVMGVLRPVIVLPKDGVESEVALAHEAAHIEHQDLAYVGVYRLFQGVFGLLPFAHLLVRELAFWQEVRADETAIRCTGHSPSQLAHTILAHCRAPSLGAMLPISGTTDDLRRRLEMLFDARRSGWQASLALALALVASWPNASPVAANSTPEPAPTAVATMIR